MKLARKSDGKLWAYTEWGGYPLVYLAKDGGDLCPACANQHGSETTNDPEWKLMGVHVHYEGPPIHCDNCNREIESAYGDPEDE